MSITLSNLCFGPMTVFFGADDIGATEEGAVITRTPEYLLVQPEQVPGAVISYLVSEGYTIAFTTIEPTIKNLDLFVFGTDGTGTSPHDFGGEDTPTGHDDFIVYGTTPGGFQRTIAWHHVIAGEPGDWGIGRKAAHSNAVKLIALCSAAVATLGEFGTLTDAAS